MSVFSAVFDADLFIIKRYGPGTKDALGRTTRQLVYTSPPLEGRLDLTGTVEGETFVVDKFRSTMPAGTDLRSGDEVEAEGKTYTVEGTPLYAHVPGMRSIGVVTAVLKYVGPVAA